MPTISSLSNADVAEDMHEATVKRVEQQRADARKHAETRETLETPPMPVEDGEGIDEGAEDRPGFAMTEKRRIGSQTINVGEQTYRFGKPSGFASADIDDELDEICTQPTLAVVEWAAGTLEHWHLDDDGPDWGHEHGLDELVTAVRALQLGGNGGGR